ncbi:hypothetical protein SM12_02740 [Klebsiella pneumoniae]|uniref:DUF551 domain-containing protein n=1 Tax=Klebsiella pneumoniae TaxID=573 RepID=UPI00065808F5|nr:DUF551 domain-containing protein [Klebsiella pneumoniae]KME78676.1 hypothetical protein SM12_02740 [Klebsiella pneumoniae]
MTKSTITRERLQEIAEDGFLKQGESKELARIALAAMDSEPVAIIDQANLDYLRSGADADVWPPEREGMGDVLLYRHPQPAPVVSAELLHTAASAIEDLLTTKDRMGVYVCFDLPFRLRSAANAQPAPAAPVCTCPSGDGSLRWPCPVHPGNSPAQSDCCPAQNCIHSAQGVDRPVAWHHTAKSKEGNHGTCCFSYASSHDFGPRYEKPQSQPHYLPERLDYDRALHFLSTEPRKVTPETVIGGSSPVIPEGWTGNDKANAALMMLDRIETVDPVDDDRIDGIKRIVRELAAAQHDTSALNPVQSVVTVPGKWIPVSERMPESNGVYFGWDGKRVLEVNCFFGGFSANQFIHGEITHWMPLPAAPQEVNHG